MARDSRAPREAETRVGVRLPAALISATAIEHTLRIFRRNRRNCDGVRGSHIREGG